MKELPVYNVDIPVVYEDEKLLVINKPASIPIHVCGAYNKNTILNILKEEKGYQNLHTLHRIDRVTSGVLLIGKKGSFAKKAVEAISKQQVKKVYLARVEGIVEKDHWIVDKPLRCKSHKEGTWEIYEGKMDEKIEEKIEESKKPEEEHEKKTYDQKKIRKMKDDERKKRFENGEAKQSLTEFKLLWSDEKTNTSLIQCHPKTGRTHQIRLHLRYSGHNIINDVVYGGKNIGNFYKTIIEKNLVTDDQLLKKKNFEDLEK